MGRGFFKGIALLVLLGTAGSVTAAQARATAGHAARNRTWARATAFRRPAFRARRRIRVRTATAFWQAWRNLRPGDLIDVRGVTFHGEAALTDKWLSGWAEVHFDRGTRFAGAPGSALPAAWVNADRDVRFYGGAMTNPRGGAGMIVYDSSHVTWWGFSIHGSGGTGLMVNGIRRVNDHLDFKGTISHWGLNLGLDPHAEKGTGLHGALLGDARYGVRDSRFALYVHDGRTGAGVQAGGATSSDGFWDNTLYLRCRNLTMQARSQIGGNCLQVWGEHVLGNRVVFLAADHIEGRPYDANGMYAGQSLASDTIVYGRATRTNLNRDIARTEPGLPARQVWDTRHGTVLRNVRPRTT